MGEGVEEGKVVRAAKGDEAVPEENVEGGGERERVVRADAAANPAEKAVQEAASREAAPGAENLAAAPGAASRAEDLEIDVGSEAVLLYHRSKSFSVNIGWYFDIATFYRRFASML